VVVGIDHLFCFSLVLGSARRPTDAAFRNFEPTKAFAASGEYCPEARTGRHAHYHCQPGRRSKIR